MKYKLLNKNGVGAIEAPLAKKVKDAETGLGIYLNFHLLKPLNSNKVTEQFDNNAAARLNTNSPSFVFKHSALGEDLRRMYRIKKVSNTFVKLEIDKFK